MAPSSIVSLLLFVILLIIAISFHSLFQNFKIREGFAFVALVLFFALAMMVVVVAMVVVFVYDARSGFIVDFQFGILPHIIVMVGELEVDFGSGFRKLGAARVETIDKVGDLEAADGASMWRRRRGSSVRKSPCTTMIPTGVSTSARSSACIPSTPCGSTSQGRARPLRRSRWSFCRRCTAPTTTHATWCLLPFLRNP